MEELDTVKWNYEFDRLYDAMFKEIYELLPKNQRSMVVVIYAVYLAVTSKREFGGDPWCIDIQTTDGDSSNGGSTTDIKKYIKCALKELRIEKISEDDKSMSFLNRNLESVCIQFS